MLGNPTMSGATATCPFCCSQQPGDYIKRCGHEGKLKAQMTAVVYQEEAWQGVSSTHTGGD